MEIQTVFQRYELKYLLTQEQKEAVLRDMEPYMTLDRYGRTTIRNLYYDTDTYLFRYILEGYFSAPHAPAEPGFWRKSVISYRRTAKFML